jgi:hypothetical protein
MFSIQRNREKAMRGVVVPVIAARSMGADVLADVAARYGVGVAQGARAVLVPPGAHAESYAPNADGKLVWVQAVLAVDDAPVGDVAAVGYVEARRRAASCQIRRRKAPAKVAENKAAQRVQSLAERNAARLARVRELVSGGFARADVLADLGITDAALGALTAGQGIVWPYVKRSTKAKVARVAKPAKAAKPVRVDKPKQAAPGHSTAMIARAKAQADERKRVLRETVDNIRHALGLKDGAYLRRLIREIDPDYPIESRRNKVPRRSRWRERVFALHDQGLTPEAIAGQMAGDVRSVRRALRAAGLIAAHEGQARRMARNEVLRALVNRGLTGPQIAEIMGMTLAAVHSACARALLTIKTPKGGDMQPARDRSKIEARQAVVARMVRAGARDAEIVAATGASPATISHDKKVLGLIGQSAYAKCRPSFGRDNPALWGPVMARVAQGQSEKAIARAMGLRFWCAVGD